MILLYMHSSPTLLAAGKLFCELARADVKAAGLFGLLASTSAILRSDPDSISARPFVCVLNVVDRALCFVIRFCGVSPSPFFIFKEAPLLQDFSIASSKATVSLSLLCCISKLCKGVLPALSATH